MPRPPSGPGDRTVLERSLREVQRGDDPPKLVVVINKIDKASGDQILERLLSAKAAVEAIFDAESVEYFPVSARSGKGVDALTAYIVDSLEEGPPFFPDDVVTDTPEALWVAELVREQLLAKTHDELPHSISCRVTEWEWPHIRCEIIVERDSQKGIVIGKGGEVLKAVGHRRARHAPRRGLPRPPRQGGEALAGPRRDAQPARVLRRARRCGRSGK